MRASVNQAESLRQFPGYLAMTKKLLQSISKKMNPANNKSNNKFAPFATGVFVGVVAALLFATDEGRKIVKEALDAIPEKYKKIPENIVHPHHESETLSVPLIPSLETPHHSTYDFEAPPPPPPAVHPYRPQ